MVIVGLILFLVAAIFGLDVVDKNRFRIRAIRVFGDNLGVSGAGHLYVVGVITGAALVLGLLLLLSGLRRKGSKARSRRHERQAAEKQQGELNRLREQNADLGQKLQGRAGGANAGYASDSVIQAPGPPTD